MSDNDAITVHVEKLRPSSSSITEPRSSSKTLLVLVALLVGLLVGSGVTFAITFVLLGGSSSTGGNPAEALFSEPVALSETSVIADSPALVDASDSLLSTYREAVHAVPITEPLKVVFNMTAVELEDAPEAGTGTLMRGWAVLTHDDDTYGEVTPQSQMNEFTESLNIVDDSSAIEKLAKIMPDDVYTGGTQSTDLEAARRKLVIVGSSDGRAEVTCTAGTQEFPHSAMVDFFAGSSWCSGSLIGDDWVLTAAHCIWRTDGTWNIPNRVHPRSCSGNNFQAYTANAWWVHANYRTGRDRTGYDVGLIRLNRQGGQSAGSRYGTFSMQSVEGLGATFPASIYGYPAFAGNPIRNPNQGASQQIHRLWGEAGSMFNRFSNSDTNFGNNGQQLTSRTIDVTGGQSGGPCFTSIGGRFNVIGTVRGSFSGRWTRDRFGRPTQERWNDCVALTSDKIADIISGSRSPSSG